MGKLDGNEGSDSGTSIDKNLEAVIFHGFVDAKLYSYEEQHLLMTPDTEVMQAGHQNAHQFKSYRRLLQNLWNIKYVLSILQIPIVFGAKVYESFFTLDAHNCVRMPKQEEILNENGLVGYHAMTLVSYNDHEQNFEVQNSWEDFGDPQGCHFIPYSYVLDHSLCFDMYILEQ